MHLDHYNFYKNKLLRYPICLSKNTLLGSTRENLKLVDVLVDKKIFILYNINYN